MTRLTRILLLTGALLVGCSGNVTQPTAGDSPTPGAASADREAGAVAEAVPEGTVLAAAADCLEGRWEAESSTLTKLPAVLFAIRDIPVVFETSGTTVIVFENGTYTHEEVDAVLTSTFPGDETSTTTLTRNARKWGTYEADATHLTLTYESGDGVTDVSVTVDGRPVDEVMPADELGADGWMGSPTYECLADELRVTTDLRATGLEGQGLDDVDLTMVFHRH